MSAAIRALILELFSLGLGPGDIAYAVGLPKGTVYLFLIRKAS